MGLLLGGALGVGGGISAGVLTLATACGEAQQSPPAGEPASSGASVPGKVEFWYGLNADGVQPFVDDFKRDFPHITLNFAATADHANKLYTAALRGQHRTSLLASPRCSGQLSPQLQMLDDVIKGDKELKRDNYWPGYWDFHKFKGKMSMLPMQANNRLVFYDKAVLDENRVPEPKTWDDFRAACRTLTARTAPGAENVTRWGYQCEPGVAGLRATIPPWANCNGFVAWNQDVTRSGWGSHRCRKPWTS